MTQIALCFIQVLVHSGWESCNLVNIVYETLKASILPTEKIVSSMTPCCLGNKRVFGIKKSPLCI